MQISEHEVEFFDCREIVGGGPEACSILIDGQEIIGKRFDPSPLPYKSGILVPARKSNFLTYGYALCLLDPKTLKGKFVSKVFPYMKLIGIYDGYAEVLRTTYGNDIIRIKIKD